MANTAIIPLDDPAFWQDPYPLLSRLREEHRTATTDAGIKAILRWTDCEALLKSGDFINQGLEYLDERGFRAGDPLYEWRRYSIGALNGPDHSRIRSRTASSKTILRSACNGNCRGSAMTNLPFWYFTIVSARTDRS